MPLWTNPYAAVGSGPGRTGGATFGRQMPSQPGFDTYLGAGYPYGGLIAGGGTNVIAGAQSGYWNPAAPAPQIPKRRPWAMPYSGSWPWPVSME